MIQVKGLIRAVSPPALHEIYRLPAPFIGDGTNYIDTGVKLMEYASSDFTLLMRADRVLSLDGDRVFISCFSEELPYRGLLVRNDWATTTAQISVLLGQNWSSQFSVATPSFTVAIRKGGQLCDVFIDGARLGNQVYVDWGNSYANSLLIGAQWDASNQIFRRSQTTVRGLAVFDAPLTDDALQAQLAIL